MIKDLNLNAEEEPSVVGQAMEHICELITKTDSASECALLSYAFKTMAEAMPLAEEPEEETHSCGTCLYSSTPEHVEPCKSCDEVNDYWKPKEGGGHG